MKHILIAIALIFSFSALFLGEALAQNTKQPKLRIYSGFLSTKYELGDKDVTTKDIRLHLEKTSPEAYLQWRKSESAGITALVGSLIGLGGVVYGVVAAESEQKAIGYLVGATGWTISLVGTLSSGARKEKAATIYNRQFGY